MIIGFLGFTGTLSRLWQIELIIFDFFFNSYAYPDFPCLTALACTFKAMLNISGASGYPCLTPDL